ncbi:MAG: hypothetical protein JJE04_03780 [Acidobacteriia bacterium]|nr:hypothetical protein [Terriglobia bacterium]
MRRNLAFLLLGVTASAVTPCTGAQADRVAFHEERIAARPGDVDALRMLANALIARAEASGNGSDYNRAESVLDRCDRLDPWHPPNVLARARLLLSRHRFASARALSEDGLRRFPSEIAFLEISADGALETGDLESAGKYAGMLVERKPQMSSWARLAHVFEVREQWDKALEFQTKALDAAMHGTPPAPPESRAWCRAILGEMHLKAGDAPAAREQYRLGLLDSPGHPLVLEHLAELEQQEGNEAAAAEAYKSILDRQRNPLIELRLADLPGKQNNQSEAASRRLAAIEFLESAVASGNEGYLRPLAEQRLQQGRFEDAAQLQVRDVLLRPTPDACEVLSRISQEASRAGKPLESTGTGICHSYQKLKFSKISR